MGSAGLRLRRAGSPQHVLAGRRESRGRRAPRRHDLRRRGAGACNCRFVKTYPYSFGPRIGASYQINPKTVLRGGWGITYAQTGIGQADGGSTLGAGGWNTFNFQSPAFGEPGALLRTGLVYDRDALFEVTNNAGIRPSPGQVDSPPQWIHPDAGKMPRLNQWSISLQREITRDLVVDVAYVGNRGKGSPPTT